MQLYSVQRKWSNYLNSICESSLFQIRYFHCQRIKSTICSKYKTAELCFRYTENKSSEWEIGFIFIYSINFPFGSFNQLCIHSANTVFSPSLHFSILLRTVNFAKLPTINLYINLLIFFCFVKAVAVNWLVVSHGVCECVRDVMHLPLFNMNFSNEKLQPR